MKVLPNSRKKDSSDSKPRERWNLGMCSHFIKIVPGQILQPYRPYRDWKGTAKVEEEAKIQKNEMLRIRNFMLELQIRIANKRNSNTFSDVDNQRRIWTEKMSALAFSPIWIKLQ